MRITRRRLLKATGEAGAVVLAERAPGQLVRRVGGRASLASSRAITSRTLTETSRTRMVPVGAPLRFGLGLKRGDVPSDSSILLKDGGGNTVPAQFDALNYWPDGSIRFCEVLGYSARAISAGGSDTISVSSVAGSFNNKLPADFIPSQLLINLQSFNGAQDLVIECSSMVSATGASNAYSSGTWIARFNALAAGPYVQQINKGPCCMGFRAWGQPTNGSINHPHIHVGWYVWLWLNPSNGAIRDVEYLVYLHNSLLNCAADGTSYAVFPPDRYNYNPSLKNGATTIAPLALHPGGLKTVGGHHIRAGWFTARADGKPRWIGDTLEARNLQITLDPVQPNPQTNLAARSYLLSTGLIPKYDIAGVNATDPPTGPATPIQYAPMAKGLWDDERFSDWNTGVGIDSGGAHASIGMIPQWDVRDLMLQTVTTAQNRRVSALGFASIPRMFLDINGRVPNIRNQDYTGMTGCQPLTFIQGDYTAYYHYNVAKSTESATASDYCYGNWASAEVYATPHWPSGAFYTYVMDGGAHNRDIVLMGAAFALMCKGPHESLYPGGVFPPEAGGTTVCRAPVLAGNTYYGVVLGSTLAPRDDAWGLREIVFAAAVAPTSLADGTAFGEGQFFKDCLRDTFSYAAALIGVFPAVQVKNGWWNFYNGAFGSPQTSTPASSGSDDPWMQSYLGEAAARAKILHGGETFGSAIASFVSMHQNYFTGILGGTFCSVLACAQTVNIKNGRGPSTFKSDWPNVGKFPSDSVYPGDVWAWADFIDTVNGWIFLHPAHSVAGAFPNFPFDLGTSLIFTYDYFGTALGLGQSNAPPPFIMETQTYYIVAIDSAGFKIRVSTTARGAPVIAASTVTNVLYNILDTSSCPSRFVRPGAGGPTGNITNLVRAVRSYRTAGDSAALQTADTNGTYWISNTPTDFSSWPMGKVLV